VNYGTVAAGLKTMLDLQDLTYNKIIAFRQGPATFG